jgi:predicted glutamine amidotransferase
MCRWMAWSGQPVLVQALLFEPGTYRSVSPAWGDANLRELAAHIESPMLIAHVRATTGTAIQETNCHPFRHGLGCSSTTARSPALTRCAVS